MDSKGGQQTHRNRNSMSGSEMVLRKNTAKVRGRGGLLKYVCGFLDPPPPFRGEVYPLPLECGLD